ncbi:MAG: 1-acyl-sn-glycerol-3-phosphate acyltransferase, partial [Thermoanaerobaculia bacterium]|nr:1-acyl-sn-glycerol-3-phosphate acyltransferase [Thermoanaerobaculia bacterium]
LCRVVNSLGARYVLDVRGLEHVAPERDPFLLVLNHNQRYEAVLIPTLLVYHRSGRLIHFMADWHFMLMPFVAMLYRQSRVILIANKDALWKPLNVFRPLFTDGVPPFERALERLRGGASVGIFPESTINRDPTRLLRGSTGAARLALDSGVPIVAAGIRFPNHDPAQPIRDGERMTLEICPPIVPERPHGPEPTLAEVRALHQTLMETIARACGKHWSPQARRRRASCR